ncbi:hemolysin family protein [Blautia sp. MSJ-19]|uniref:hemolysin family protein n=1 Tax=Blautia sp. MSJ-19 TaxID=2841517 RepID=UPI001C0ECC27|nr:hemolysin family protein [Blautia sp. MSJ-19]MBU5481536.1 hemolysin family protein [Blautia sp. MSJ-19]
MDDGSRLPRRGLAGIADWITEILSGILHALTGKQRDAVTEKEIISMVDEAHEKGVLQKDEAEMIQNIFDFEDKEVGAVMTHRSSVAAFSLEDLLKYVVDHMIEEGNSRYPVCGEDMDDIRGLIHYKDALKFYTQNPWAKFKPLKELPGLIREATFVPETRNIGQLFRTMQARQVHMAVVVDEYGQTAGIVTMEDILEEIVGDIFDEYDESRDTFRTQVDNSIIIDGLASLEDVAQELDIDFGDVPVETLNGYLIAFLGHIPTSEDLDREIVANGYRFKILSLGNRTIGRVRAEKINDKETKGESEKCQDIQNSQT